MRPFYFDVYITPLPILLIKQITLSSVESYLHYQKPTEPSEMS